MYLYTKVVAVYKKKSRAYWIDAQEKFTRQG